MPDATSARYDLHMVGSIRHIVLVWPVRKLLALIFGMYFNFLARFRTRSFVASLISVCPRNTFDIVIFERFRSSAISFIRTGIRQAPRGGPRRTHISVYRI